MGKTNMIQNMAIQDIRNGKGVAIVDPHGEFAEECLKAVPANRVNDVIYFNPADTEFPIAMNVMEKVGPEFRHLVCSGLVGVFKKIWADSWGPRLEYLLRNAILALLEYPTSTLLGVTRLLIDTKYREKVLEKVTDPVVKAFWQDEFTKYHDRLMADAIAPIQNKVGQFLSSSLIRNIVGQTRSSFSIREVMDQEKILIMNLSKGRVGEDNSALLGAMMITKIQLAAMARVDTQEVERKDFYLYVDEFQNFATESFAGILSEARKYRLNLILAHQYISQLDEKVRDAVFGNVGTLITFRVGAMDAEILEKEFEPSFYATDLVNLAKYHVYLKLMIDGVATTPFSAGTIPPIDISDTSVSVDKVIRVSRERYGSKREEVEEKISRWSGVMKTEVQNKVADLVKKSVNVNSKVSPKKTSSIVQDTKEEKIVVNNQSIKQQVKKNDEIAVEERPQVELFQAECSACGITVEVPFKPDGRRPVFCKDCLKE
jgi:CxxC-x17-CxxC domain-containing protein